MHIKLENTLVYRCQTDACEKDLSALTRIGSMQQSDIRMVFLTLRRHAATISLQFQAKIRLQLNPAFLSQSYTLHSGDTRIQKQGSNVSAEKTNRSAISRDRQETTNSPGTWARSKDGIALKTFTLDDGTGLRSHIAECCTVAK
jgi:hypothetical protein